MGPHIAHQRIAGCLHWRPLAPPGVKIANDEIAVYIEVNISPLVEYSTKPYIEILVRISEHCKHIIFRAVHIWIGLYFRAAPIYM